MKQFKNQFQRKVLFFQIKVPLMLIFQIMLKYIITEKSDKHTTKETLCYVHIAISNAERNFLENHHKIKREYLQFYLNEFVYKLNRRYFGERLFDRLIIASITGV